MSAFTAVLPDGRLVAVELVDGWWEARTTLDGEPVAYRRHRPLAAALEGAGVPAGTYLVRTVEPVGQLDLFAAA